MGKRDHEPGKLVPVTLRKLPDGWHADGGNLYLFVRGASRTWVFRFTAPDGKRKNMGLGSLADVGLAQARDLAKQLRAKVKDPTAPTDPQRERIEARQAVKLEQARRMTFKQCAEACIEALRPGWKNPKHGQQWENTLSAYTYPIIGDLPVADVDTPLVVKCLGPIWTTKNETASRLRGRIEVILDWAKVNKLRSGENPARWKGHLDKLLAAPTKVQKAGHHAALPYAQMGEFMQGLRTKEGMGARALEFAILTATRSGEVRGAKWSEIDQQARTWTIPADRMKAGKEHRVPLSDAAMALLTALPRLDDEDLVFPSTKRGRPLSDMTLTAVLRRMERGDLTAHGFRSTFRDWAGETTAYPREVIEHALAHQLRDKAEAAYQRGDLLEKRRRLMGDWANYCETVHSTTANVTQLRGAA
ncbi:MAG: tyrosine-type recombinase/integrase [Proteobacteria bacterium]|nr:tyrosine-type recombinase/integrase [Pseudomonadota bacterium]